MAPTLLQTKLFVPPARPRLVNRARLVEKLDQARLPGCQVLLVCAPAGFGKTTLVTQWINRLDWPVGWLSLDEADNQPARFLRYLIAACQRVDLSAGHEAQALVDLAHIDIDEIISLLSNDLADAAQPFLLALDDYYNIREPLVHQAVRLLMDALPPQAHLLLLSREDPPLPVARLRARGQLVELRSGELRFTTEEALAFLNHSMGLALTLEQVQALEERTEGWIAGLQMAALALQSMPAESSDSSARDRANAYNNFIAAFSGSHRFILDYLVEEVLGRQPREIQDFLMHTSILARFNAGLCDAILSPLGSAPEAGSQAFLDHLERANLFIIPLDNERCWYRFHHLFAELLRARLKATRPEIITGLHQRAADWFEQHNDPRSALEHALTAQDFSHAADLIDANIVPRWRETDIEFFLASERLPQALLFARPSLCLQCAWTAVITGQIQAVPGLLEAAERQLQQVVSDRPANLTPQEQGMLAFARVLRAYLDDFANRTIHLDDSFQRVIDTVPEENVGMRNTIAVLLGSIYYMEGRFSSAAQFFLDAIQRDKQANGTNAVPISSARWARMLVVEGRLREAAWLCQENEAYIRARGARRFYVAGNLPIMLGSVLREWNRLDEAEQNIREGLRLLESWPVPHSILIGYYGLAQVQIARGDLESAAGNLERCTQIARQSPPQADLMQAYQSGLIRLWAAQGNTAALAGWLAENPLPAEQPYIFRQELNNISRARALLALGQASEAIPLLRQQAAAAEAGGRLGHLIEILALLSAHLPPAQAHPYLEKSLRLGEPEGYLRVFLDCGPGLAQRLAALEPHIQDARLMAYLRTIQAAQSGAAFEHAPITSSSGRPQPHTGKSALSQPNAGIFLPEPLSQRELEVLRLVAQGLSSQQVADRLVISVRTVKKHLENIYGKLGVDGRVQAIARAREYNWL